MISLGGPTETTIWSIWHELTADDVSVIPYGWMSMATLCARFERAIKATTARTAISFLLAASMVM
ncbi:Non-ribosomal peptide synthetase module protein%2C siderophore biosynthesis [Vibrio cholerae]|nr:Non-ribosomal peptide synthetase module protein%2C siderophore biosynthesis [Vibrio cholerae]